MLKVTIFHERYIWRVNSTGMCPGSQAQILISPRSQTAYPPNTNSPNYFAQSLSIFHYRPWLIRSLVTLRNVISSSSPLSKEYGVEFKVPALLSHGWLFWHSSLMLKFRYGLKCHRGEAKDALITEKNSSILKHSAKNQKQRLGKFLVISQLMNSLMKMCWLNS